MCKLSPPIADGRVPLPNNSRFTSQRGTKATNICRADLMVAMETETVRGSDVKRTLDVTHPCG